MVLVDPGSLYWPLGRYLWVLWNMRTLNSYHQLAVYLLSKFCLGFFFSSLVVNLCVYTLVSQGALLWEDYKTHCELLHAFLWYETQARQIRGDMEFVVWSSSTCSLQCGRWQQKFSHLWFEGLCLSSIQKGGKYSVSDILRFVGKSTMPMSWSCASGF